MLTTLEEGALSAVNWDFAGAKTGHSTHGLHPYPAKYIPQIPHSVIKELSKPGEIVADIFCGSGTTLVEALTLGRHAKGVDANPLACLISDVKTSRFTGDEAEQLRNIADRAQRLSSSLDGKPFASSAPRPDSSAISFWFEQFVVEELAEALSWCEAMHTDIARKVAQVAFSSIIVSVSKQDSDTRYVRRDKNLAPGDTLKRFSRAVLEATKAVEAFTEDVSPELTCNVWQASLLAQPDIGPVDLVVCSPPYPNAYSYHLYHMTRMVWLGMDQPTFKREEIGSHRKYSSKSKNGATAQTFRDEMSAIFVWLGTHLAVGRYACFVVGNSTIRGEKVNNADLIAEAARLAGFIEVGRLGRQMQSSKKSFNPYHGRIKTEDIVILQNRAKASA